MSRLTTSIGTKYKPNSGDFESHRLTKVEMGDLRDQFFQPKEKIDQFIKELKH